MSDRKDAERAAFERVFYPGSRVLVNELGLREAASLDAAERLFTDTRIEEGMPARAGEPLRGGQVPLGQRGERAARGAAAAVPARDAGPGQVQGRGHERARPPHGIAVIVCRTAHE